MSGGFFRGTSADQDTRFSNKQAKLMKSQKFAPELDHLVDMGKVKIDALKPWIATRATELLGFEDEVLINFIYGLLEGKVVNGKEIQISLTGFMEKNTGKFMKELWVLLLSAEKNASGVPQQFLDAKEEEIKKKMAESDRITSEIQKKKKEAELEKQKKMDVEVLGALDDASCNISKHMLVKTDDYIGDDEKNGSKEIERQTPRKSISKSYSRSRSYSSDRHNSRSLSRSPQPRRRSISPERKYDSSRKRSLSPRRNRSPRRPRSPLRRRFPYLRRRSSSRSWRRSPSPRRRRSPSLSRRVSPPPSRRRSISPARSISSSPVQRRSPSPVRRRVSSPSRRRSSPPIRRRSPSPFRRRSPARRRSPNHVRRRSPPPSRRWSPSFRRRSPSPFRRRSPSPFRRRSPQSPLRRRSPSPLKRRSPESPPRCRSPSPFKRRSPQPSSPRERGSPLQSPRQTQRSPRTSRKSLSRDQEVRSNGFESKRTSRRSSASHSPDREDVGHNISWQPVILRSPQRDLKDRRNVHREGLKLSLSPKRSPSRSDSLPMSARLSPGEDRKSPTKSPVQQTRGRITQADGASIGRQTTIGYTRHDSPKTIKREEPSRTRGQRSESAHKSIEQSSSVGRQRNNPKEDFHQEEYNHKDISGRRLGESHSRLDIVEEKREDHSRKSEKAPKRTGYPGSFPGEPSNMSEDEEYSPGRRVRTVSSLDNNSEKKPIGKQLENVFRSNERLQKSDSREEQKDEAKIQSQLQTGDDGGRVYNNSRADSFDSDLKPIGKKDAEYIGKRKHKRSEKHDITSDDASSPDSQVDERKEAKRRRKEEKRSLRKEEKRRRREERHRRKEERRAIKLKAKSLNTVSPPSDTEKKWNDSDGSGGDFAPRRDSRLMNTQEAESETKRLEIELREKALQSLRAKKSAN